VVGGGGGGGGELGLVWVAGGVGGGGSAAPANAQNEPVIVVPGRPGVPVLMWGVDISGAVLEGEFGLNRPGRGAPTVIMPYWQTYQFYAAPPARYFPPPGHNPPTPPRHAIPPP